MSTALSGKLQDFGMADIFQLIGQQRKTGILEFTSEEGERVELRFDRGMVVSAAPSAGQGELALGEMLVRCGRLTKSQLERLKPESEATAQTLSRLAVSRGWIEADEVDRIQDVLTRETLFDVLRWERGEFDFRAQNVEHGRQLEALLGAEQILMDSLRMVDEWYSFCELVPEEAVFQRVAGVEEYRRRTQLPPDQAAEAERVFGLVNGRIRVRRIVDVSLLGTFDAVRLLADMRRCEVIEPLGPEALERLRSVPQPMAGTPREERPNWLAAVVPLVALALLCAWSLTREPPPVSQGVAALPQQTRAALDDAYATRRARHALEAHRFVTGSWPDRLADVTREGLLADGVLAAPDTAAYYYARRDEGVVLLAPAR